MEAIMHSNGTLMSLGIIDYKNESMVEEQCALRRDMAEVLSNKGDNQSLVEAGVLHGEVNEITRRFVAGKALVSDLKTITTGTHLPFLKGHLANKLADELTKVGWPCGAAIKRGRGLSEAICPIADVETDLDMQILKSDLFDIATSILNVISKLK